MHARDGVLALSTGGELLCSYQNGDAEIVRAICEQDPRYVDCLNINAGRWAWALCAVLVATDQANHAFCWRIGALQTRR